jgi:hypothetical protein
VVRKKGHPSFLKKSLASSLWIKPISVGEGTLVSGPLFEVAKSQPVPNKPFFLKKTSTICILVHECSPVPITVSPSHNLLSHVSFWLCSLQHPRKSLRLEMERVLLTMIVKLLLHQRLLPHLKLKAYQWLNKPSDNSSSSDTLLSQGKGQSMAHQQLNSVASIHFLYDYCLCIWAWFCWVIFYAVWLLINPDIKNKASPKHESQAHISWCIGWRPVPTLCIMSKCTVSGNKHGRQGWYCLGIDISLICLNDQLW